MQLKEWVALERGRLRRLSNDTGMTYTYLCQIANHHRPVPIEHAASIERYTLGQVSRKEMFPNDWQRIWPELDDKPLSPSPPLKTP